MKNIKALPKKYAAGVLYVLFDIDDTITKDGQLLLEAYEAIWAIHNAGLKAVPVTGRPAGWCDLIARQWPVAGVVGENGAFAFYMKNNKLERIYHPEAPEPEATELKLKELGNSALRAFPGLRIAKDQPYRIFDVALDFAEEEPNLGLDLAVRVKGFCESRGAVAKVSSIHVNAWFGNYDKLSMAEYFLSECFAYNSEKDLEKVLFFGDSPNDEPMFKHFPLSCAVSNIQQYTEIINYKPQYVTSSPFGYGFKEGIEVLLQLKEKK